MRPDTNHSVPLRLTAPPDLVVAIPALLGFHPTDSLVLVSIGQGDTRHVRFALRIDLPPPEGWAEAARHLFGMDAVRESDEMFLVVVGGGEPPGPGDSPPGAELVLALVEHCATAGTVPRGAVWAAEIAKDAPWSCYQSCRCVGRLPDPACSPVAAEAVASGKVIYPRRADVERLVRPGDGPTLARRSELISSYLERVDREGWELPFAGAEGLALIDRWVGRATRELPRLTDRDVLSLCLALTDPLVRDVCLGMALGASADRARRLWATLVHEFPDPEAAEPALLLAFDAVLRGDGALATVALERAQEAWPGHHLSATCLSALSTGASPSALMEMFAEGIADAERALNRTGSRS